jgi:hypothetical protein
MNVRVPDDILALVKSNMRNAFTKFVRTGKLDPEFQKFLDANEDAQKAVELVLNQRLGAIEHIGAVMAGKVAKGSPSDSVEDEAVLISQALLDLAARETEVRGRVTELSANYIRDHSDSESRNEIIGMLEQLMDNLKARTDSFGIRRFERT